LENYNRYFELTCQKQTETLKPHEKSRTVFSIFFEQVIEKILRDKAHSGV